MSMVESSVRETPAEIRRRLFNPPGGHFSSELDIVAKPIAERMNFDNSARLSTRVARERDLLKKGRLRRAAELAQEYQNRLSAWVLGADTEPVAPEIPRILFEQIIITVCKFYSIHRNQIISAKRNGSFVRPRHVAMYLGTELTGLSLPQIGARLGGRDHTTILYGRDKIKGLLATGDPQLTAEIAVIKESMEAE